MHIKSENAVFNNRSAEISTFQSLVFILHIFACLQHSFYKLYKPFNLYKSTVIYKFSDAHVYRNAYTYIWSKEIQTARLLLFFFFSFDQNQKALYNKIVILVKIFRVKSSVLNESFDNKLADLGIACLHYLVYNFVC